MKSACNTRLNPIDGDGHAASQVTETPFDRGKVSYLRSSLQSYHLQVVSGSGSHARGLIRARLGIRSSCDLLPIRRRAPASYELATVSRFGAPRHLTRLGTGHNMISAYEHGRNAAKHAKHIQACPFDTGTPEWREWRAGFCAVSQISPNSFYRLAMGTQRRARPSRGTRARQSLLLSIPIRSRHAS